MGPTGSVAWERAMKIQEVILRAMAKRITWWQAAEIIGISERQMRRWHRRYEKWGYDGLWDRRRGGPSPRTGTAGDGAASLAAVRGEVFRFQREPFSREAPGATRHRSQLHLGEAGLAGRGAGAQGETARHAPPADGRGDRFRECCCIWTAARTLVCRSERRYDLLVVLDDATSEIYYAQLVEQESTRTVLEALREVVALPRSVLRAVQRPGQPFLRTPKAGGKIDRPASDASGAGAAGVGGSHDPGLLAAGSWTHGAQLRDLARAPGAGVAAARDHYGGGRRPFSAPGAHAHGGATSWGKRPTASAAAGD